MSGRRSTSAMKLKSSPSAAGTLRSVISGCPSGRTSSPREPCRRAPAGGVVDGLLEHGSATDALLDDPGRDLPRRNPGTWMCSPMCLIAASRLGPELLERDLDGQLDPGRAEGLERTLHCGYSKGTVGRGMSERDAATAHARWAHRHHAIGRRVPALNALLLCSAPCPRLARRPLPMRPSPPCGPPAAQRRHRHGRPDAPATRIILDPEPVPPSWLAVGIVLASVVVATGVIVVFGYSVPSLPLGAAPGERRADEPALLRVQQRCCAPPSPRRRCSSRLPCPFSWPRAPGCRSSWPSRSRKRRSSGGTPGRLRGPAAAVERGLEAGGRREPPQRDPRFPCGSELSGIRRLGRMPLGSVS